MLLRDALREFSAKRLTKLRVAEARATQEACAKYQAAAGKHTEDNAKRVQRIFALLKNSETSALTNRDLRHIATAIGNEPVSAPSEAQLVLSEVERRHNRRLFDAVFASLLSNYRNDGLNKLIIDFIRPHAGQLRSATRPFVQRTGILENGFNLDALATRLLSGADIRASCVFNGIGSRVLSSNFGTALKLQVLRNAVVLVDEHSLRDLIDWSFTGIIGTPVGEYYEAMLEPFKDRQPKEGVQRVLMQRLIERFRDPRLNVWPVPDGKGGTTRRDLCVSILRRWLSIEYLDLFIKIIETTAVDRQFKPRKSFWLKYFEKDKISDVTLILASEADKAARKMQRQLGDAEHMQWAKLGQALSNQSVLLMRLGDLVIAEWSHSGAIRFWKSRDGRAPEFHLQEYTGPQLRNGSLTVRSTSGERNSIIHHENGEWMNSASDTIHHYTGVAI
jgi:EH_Signature domain